MVCIYIWYIIPLWNMENIYGIFPLCTEINNVCMVKNIWKMLYVYIYDKYCHK